MAAYSYDYNNDEQKFVFKYFLISTVDCTYTHSYIFRNLDTIAHMCCTVYTSNR